MGKEIPSAGFFSIHNLFINCVSGVLFFQTTTLENPIVHHNDTATQTFMPKMRPSGVAKCED